MVERRADDVDVVVLGLQPEEEQHAAQAHRRLLGRGARERPAHPFGPSGGARRVVHHVPGRAVRGQVGGLTVLQVLVGAEAGNVADREPSLVREADLVGRGGADVGEAFVGDEDLGLAVVDDVRDLGADQVVVDRHEIPTRLEGGEVELEHRRPIRQHHGDRITRVQSQRA